MITNAQYNHYAKAAVCLALGWFQEGVATTRTQSTSLKRKKDHIIAIKGLDYLTRAIDIKAALEKYVVHKYYDD